MANINDFKLVNKYSKDYFKNIKTNNKIDESQNKRLGFYLLILECVTGNPNLDDLQDSIIDTEFCKLVYNKRNNDYGIDAVYIDEENHTIKLFNYKTCNKIVTYYSQFKNVSRIFYESFTRLLYRINKYLLAYLDKFMTKTYN